MRTNPPKKRNEKKGSENYVHDVIVTRMLIKHGTGMMVYHITFPNMILIAGYQKLFMSGSQSNALLKRRKNKERENESNGSRD